MLKIYQGRMIDDSIIKTPLQVNNLVNSLADFIPPRGVSFNVFIRRGCVVKAVLSCRGIHEIYIVERFVPKTTFELLFKAGLKLRADIGGIFA
jgi:hypothetical protein